MLSRHGANVAHIYLGVVTDEPGTSASRQSVSISFFDDEIYLEAIRRVAAQHARGWNGAKAKDDMLFFEVPGFIIVTLRPFLKLSNALSPARSRSAITLPPFLDPRRRRRSTLPSSRATPTSSTTFAAFSSETRRARTWSSIRAIRGRSRRRGRFWRASRGWTRRRRMRWLTA